MTLRVSVERDIGERDGMEDSYSTHQNFVEKGWFFGGVYDGHGDFGLEAVSFVAQNVPVNFRKALLVGMSPEEAFQESYKKTAQDFPFGWGGSCAANFLITPKKVFCGNVGDCRVLVVNDKRYRQLSFDHRVAVPSETERILEVGGLIENRRLISKDESSWIMVSRSIGDPTYREVGLIETPHITVCMRRSWEFLVAGSDGLFDKLSNADVVKVVRKFKSPKRISSELKKIAENSDNLVVLVARL
ncbi:MAG: protein serine/threonine phosphatase 2C family protein [Parcubacteria group bacterium]|nr:protein serine/threonine phosphatase 2C family protein [Parcubacteria group bacterium]